MRVGLRKAAHLLAAPVRALARAWRRTGLRRGAAAAVGLLFAAGLAAGWLGSRLLPQGTHPGEGRSSVAQRAKTATALSREGSGAPGVAGLGATGEGQAPIPARLPEAGGQAGTPEPARGATGVQGAFVPYPGELQWPAEGLILTTAGWRRHPDRGDWTYQPGVELAVPSGAPVRAAAAGVVASVRLDSDGYSVTVDHGGGWTTAYGRLGSVRVKAADRVRLGSVIGYAPRVPEAVPALASPDGTAPRSWPAPGWARATVSFEIRQGEESVNPLKVLGPGGFRVSPQEQAGAVPGDAEASPAQARSLYPLAGP